MRIRSTSILIALLHCLPGFSQHYVDDRQILKRTESDAAISRLQNGNTLYDFRKAYFGRLKVDVSKLRTGDTAIIHISEKLDGARGIDRNPGGTIRSYRYRIIKNTQDRIYLPDQPDKRNTTGKALRLPETMGILAPFRYAEVEASPASDRIALSREIFHYRFNDEASYFKSSDTILNAIWDLCKHTIKATTFMGLYIDGDRERIPYEADALINQLSHYALDTGYGMARNTFEYLMQNPTWPTEWHLIMHQIAWYDYRFTGNDALIRKYYGLLKLKTLEALEQPNGLVSTTAATQRKSFLDSINFGTFDQQRSITDITDWPQKGNPIAGPGYLGESDGFVFCSYNSIVNAYYYRSLQLMEEFARIQGKTDEALAYHQKAKKLQRTFNDTFVDERTGLVRDGDTTRHSSFHANFFALCFGLVSEKNKDQVKDFIRSKGMACSVYGAQFFMDALYNEGMGEYALEMLTKKDERGWYHMIETGAGMTMEAWDRKFKPNLDWNHAWGAAPTNIIAFRLMGIQPGNPGFNRAAIRPEMGGLRMAEIRMPTAKGGIHEKITQDDAYYHIELSLPRGMKADLELPVFQKDISSIILEKGQAVPTLANGKWLFRNLEGRSRISLKK